MKRDPRVLAAVLALAAFAAAAPTLAAAQEADQDPDVFPAVQFSLPDQAFDKAVFTEAACRSAPTPARLEGLARGLAGQTAL